MRSYIADPHFGHDRIIEHCKRPFRSAFLMDQTMMKALRDTEARGDSIYVLGDFSLRPQLVPGTVGVLEHPERHTLIGGNHDRITSKNPDVQATYAAFFGTIVGTEKSWRKHSLIIEDEVGGRPVRVKLSHGPQRDLEGADFALYGHVHNNFERAPDYHRAEYPWLEAARHHFNVSADVLGYRPWTLAELVARRAAGEWIW